MRIPCPLCGDRDAREFTPWGDATLMYRPDGLTDGAQAFHDYVHIRANPAGVHRELWFHETGCRAWMVVTRDTVIHRVDRAVLAEEART